MKLDEVTPVLDVHPPHQSPHGWRDFLLHIFTITIGLFIALSLEGIVEWQNHRHLAHEAERSLHAEVASNASGIDGVLNDLHQKQATLKNTVAILNTIIATKKLPPNHPQMSIDFRIVTFDSVSWKTAQASGALSYMPYDDSQLYASIYSQQELVTQSQQQAARDTVMAIAPFMDDPDEKDAPPSPQEATDVKQKVEILQAQYIIVESMMQALAAEYKKFLAAHPN